MLQTPRQRGGKLFLVEYIHLSPAPLLPPHLSPLLSLSLTLSLSLSLSLSQTEKIKEKQVSLKNKLKKVKKSQLFGTVAFLGGLFLTTEPGLKHWSHKDS